MDNARVYLAVVGPSDCDSNVAQLAEEVGRRIAQAGATLICGGLGGVMEASCRGAQSAGGLTIGLLPTDDRRSANRYIGVAIPTGLGEARNALVARAADAVIAIRGEFGTLSEIALALKMGKPVVGLDTWELVKQGRRSESILRATDPKQAVNTALRAVGRVDQLSP